MPENTAFLNVGLKDIRFAHRLMIMTMMAVMMMIMTIVNMVRVIIMTMMIIMVTLTEDVFDIVGHLAPRTGAMEPWPYTEEKKHLDCRNPPQKKLELLSLPLLPLCKTKWAGKQKELTWE